MCKFKTTYCLKTLYMQLASKVESATEGEYNWSERSHPLAGWDFSSNIQFSFLQRGNKCDDSPLHWLQFCTVFCPFSLSQVLLFSCPSLAQEPQDWEREITRKRSVHASPLENGEIEYWWWWSIGVPVFLGRCKGSNFFQFEGDTEYVLPIWLYFHHISPCSLCLYYAPIPFNMPDFLFHLSINPLSDS